MGSSFYWHDYETFGLDPLVDRPAEFAGIRTDLDLNPIGEPLEILCRLSADYLPNPTACCITGIWPSRSQSQGVCEAEFIQRIHQELFVPRTCAVGFNSVRFDDHMTRATLFRNLMDPYTREYANGNTRWDLLDVLRLAHAFRPEGLVWPKDESGHPSFKLEYLTAANGIPHEGAHSALADTTATLALARKLKQAQPKLWEHALKFRTKQFVKSEIGLAQPQPLIHVSSMFKAALGCFSLVWPLAINPDRENEILVWDLRHDPSPFLDLDVEALRERLYTPGVELEARGLKRLPTKSIHANHCPIVIRDTRILTPAIAEKFEIDHARAATIGAELQRQISFTARLKEACFTDSKRPPQDPDFSIYGGAFYSDQDKKLFGVVHQTPPARLSELKLPFLDPRLPELFFRYRARNWPQYLTPEESRRWEEHCLSRRSRPPHPGLLSMGQFQATLEESKRSHPEQGVGLTELDEWARGIRTFSEEGN